MATASSERDTVRRHSHHALTVSDIVEETHDTRTFVMDIPDSLADLYQYRPGQFCTVRIHVDGVDVLRCYSMSSAPAIDDRLAVTVKRVPGGSVSNWLHDHVVAGDALELMPPSGVFCERDGDGPIIAFCGGSGVTPVFSIVKQVLAAAHGGSSCSYANRDPSSVIFGDALAELETAHPDRLAVHHHLDSESGFVTRLMSPPSSIVRSVTRPTRDVYICGPTPFMDLVERARSTPASPLITSRSSASPTRPRSGPSTGSRSLSRRPVARRRREVATTLTITIKRKRHVARTRPGRHRARLGRAGPPRSRHFRASRATARPAWHS